MTISVVIARGLCLERTWKPQSPSLVPVLGISPSGHLSFSLCSQTPGASSTCQVCLHEASEALVQCIFHVWLRPVCLPRTCSGPLEIPLPGGNPHQYFLPLWLLAQGKSSRRTKARLEPALKLLPCFLHQIHRQLLGACCFQAGSCPAGHRLVRDETWERQRDLKEDKVQKLEGDHPPGMTKLVS